MAAIFQPKCKKLKSTPHAGKGTLLSARLRGGLALGVVLAALLSVWLIVLPSASSLSSHKAHEISLGESPALACQVVTGTHEHETRLMSIQNQQNPTGLAHYLHAAYLSLQNQQTIAPYLAVDSLSPGWEYRIEVTDFDVAIPSLPQSMDGLRVAHLTDLHFGWFVKIEDVRQMARLTASLEPDLVVITGDLVFHQESQAELEAALRAVAAIPTRYGIYATLGNHDYWHGANMVTAALKSTGIHLLQNQSREIAPGLWLTGLDDLLAGEANLTTALQSVPAGAATILLSHNPNVLPQAAHRPLLVLAGHTHAGQVKLPWQSFDDSDRPRLYARLMTAFETVGYLRRGGNSQGIGCWRYMSGWYQEGEARMYVSRGLGLVRPPFRLNCPPELTLLRLRSKGQ